MSVIPANFLLALFRSDEESVFGSGIWDHAETAWYENFCCWDRGAKDWVGMGVVGMRMGVIDGWM